VDNLKPYDVFICHKKSSGMDFAKHLKAGLEEMGLHAFFDTLDIPLKVDGIEEWENVRNRAIQESKVFILLITPGFDLSAEIRKELSIARKAGKEFIYFRQRDLGRKIVVDLGDEKIDLGKQQQVSFENKEELLRIAHRILIKKEEPKSANNQPANTLTEESNSKYNYNATSVSNELKCVACSKLITGEPHIETLNGKKYNFDSEECARTYRRLKSIYGELFE
jgi:hypothetical protein